MPTYCDVFAECVRAIDNAELIKRVSAKDKEFHFQNWFQKCLVNLNLNFDEPGRNVYPDFRLVNFTEGYEIKGLATPGRSKDYDSNSQVPAGLHRGRTIFYVFGRYPRDEKSQEYPVIDLVLCHGDFLNADHKYNHKNKSVRGFGSYGDIMIRDRKMYVVPTPFALTIGTVGAKTLILPDDYPVDDRFVKVGDLVRTEAKELLISYAFDLKTNDLTAKKIPNPAIGTKHNFSAYRLKSQGEQPVSMQPVDENTVSELSDDEIDELGEG